VYDWKANAGDKWTTGCKSKSGSLPGCSHNRLLIIVNWSVAFSVCVCVWSVTWFAGVHRISYLVCLCPAQRFHMLSYTTICWMACKPNSADRSHTHPFNCPFSGTTQVSRYQKGKTNLDFTGARDSEWQWHQLGCMQLCTSLQTDNHASTPPSVFYRPDALPAAQPTTSKHWRNCW